MIRTYVVRLSQAMAQASLRRRLYETASEERKAKADRYRLPEDKMRCLLAEALLRYAWRRAGHGEPLPSVAVNAYGKPYLPDHSDFHYSISHSGDWVILAWDSRPVGVDVEAAREGRDLDALVARYFSVEEREAMRCAPAERFYALWTAKEAYLKCRGTGFACGTQTPDLREDGRIHATSLYLRRISLADGHALAVCGSSASWSVSWLSVEEL